MVSQAIKQGKAFREYFTTNSSLKYLGNKSVGENTVNASTNINKIYIHFAGLGANNTYHIPKPVTAITYVGDSAEVLKMTRPMSS